MMSPVLSTLSFLVQLKCRENLHIYLDQAEYHAIEERGYEEEYEGGGCGPQAAVLILLNGSVCAAQSKTDICLWSKI